MVGNYIVHALQQIFREGNFHSFCGYLLNRKSFPVNNLKPLDS